MEPYELPILFEQITKYLFVSIAFASPINLSHQPGFASSAYLPAAWWLPDNAWQITITFDLSSFNSP